jgi:porphobilinogen synthase
MLPVFVADTHEATEIKAMPGVMQHSIDSLSAEIDELVEKGLTSYILFGVPNSKDARASGATDENGIVPKTIRALRERFGTSIHITTDVCVCSYTDTGHCGLVKDNRVDNDSSLEIIAQTALAHAKAGADMVAPSDMMDGRIRAIRDTLDEAGLSHIPMMSYAVKYASNLYGPFRHAADSSPQFGDRRGYQMDFQNARAALRETALDVEEGADIIMVKPGIAYLDILRELSDDIDLPLAAYQVSGEYSMIRYAALADAIDEPQVVRETWIAFRRAGANIILTYHAAAAARGQWIEP